MGVRCEGHDDLMLLIGTATAATEQHSEQIGKVFELLREVKTAVDQNAVRASARDTAVEALKVSISVVDRKIENGLRSELRECSDNIKSILGCISARKRERALAATTGFRGAILRGWKQFTGQMVLIGMGLGLWLIIWVLGRTRIFHEGPDYLLKLLGVG